MHCSKSTCLTSEQQALLTLTQLPNVGSRTLNQLLSHFGAAQRLSGTSTAQLLAEAIYDQSLTPELRRALRRIGGGTAVTASLEAVESWLAVSNRHHLLAVTEADYPPVLKQLPDPPPLLYVVGDPDVLRQAQIAIVGSRQASPTGLDNAYQFAKVLSQSGLIPVSGLALGIDGRAHEGALVGMGLTVAVLGTGVDQIYPRRHVRLAEALVDAGGALVSEYPLGTPPRAQNFPRRNRIISGLSVATLVIEASLRSGSLITAREAMEQGREVFAIPGSIHNPMSKGCHALIRQGATLVEKAEDIYLELGQQLSAFIEQPSSPLPAERPIADQSSLVTAMAAAPHAIRVPGLADSETSLPPETEALLAVMAHDAVVSVDILVERSQQTAETVTAALLELELLGFVRAAGQGYQRLR